ncbi:MAG: hypothetical protein HOZ81_33785 [Streptomyces sp.]|nr:hypothetical protein [Streptomyces sp.]NUP36247.1 hypothetical protein [Streptomyces sp.]
MITVLARLTSRPGEHESLLAVLTAYADHVKTERGTVVFQLFTEPESPRTVVAFEVYADQEALDEHSRSQQRVELGRHLEELVESASLSWLEPLAGHGLPITSPR